MGPSHPSELGKPLRRGVEGILGVRGVQDTWRVWAMESTKQGSRGLRETEVIITKPVFVCTRFSTYMLGLLVWCFRGLLTVEVEGGVSLVLLPAL